VGPAVICACAAPRASSINDIASIASLKARAVKHDDAYDKAIIDRARLADAANRDGQWIFSL
jgi:hypothetical protein